MYDIETKNHRLFLPDVSQSLIRIRITLASKFAFLVVSSDSAAVYSASDTDIVSFCDSFLVSSISCN